MSLGDLSFDDVLTELSARFIINVPDEELASVERVCFQVEQAHWFYEDFVREANPRLPSLSLKKFTARMFSHCPLLHQWANQHERAYRDFLEYKFQVPVCGAIILNTTWDRCLLVKGWAARASWGFPRGKINQDEAEVTCAVREVFEETGFDIAPHLNPDHYIECVLARQRVRLYIIPGVPETTVFAPQTRKEISMIEWHDIRDLPTQRPRKPQSGQHHHNSSHQGGGGSPTLSPSETEGEGTNTSNNKRFYMLTPFVTRLRSWIANHGRTPLNRQVQGNSTVGAGHGTLPHGRTHPRDGPVARRGNAINPTRTHPNVVTASRSPPTAVTADVSLSTEAANLSLRQMLGLAASGDANGAIQVPPVATKKTITTPSASANGTSARSKRRGSQQGPRSERSHKTAAAQDLKSLLGISASATASAAAVPDHSSASHTPHRSAADLLAQLKGSVPSTPPASRGRPSAVGSPALAAAGPSPKPITALLNKLQAQHSLVQRTASELSS
ncbi:mRNA-decapping enzyme subunit 2 [Tieghemiomyces parasiticus]|uniref:mRNA-decapping enzyme subunit 2 n=1 Tax=Tieghemiomyces parasiticus TaxID=78921 RepID=A0A9W8A532_9FUNG|nr:mRNA-decapping enzyme subunit 2 [Tieghemiomyces parasiticus]